MSSLSLARSCGASGTLLGEKAAGACAFAGAEAGCGVLAGCGGSCGGGDGRAGADAGAAGKVHGFSASCMSI